MKSPVTLLLLALLSEMAFAVMANADEGMWTFDKLPLERFAADHNFTPPRGWSDHLRNSAVRLAQGCSGSFVSSKGLVLSNHHCVRACLQGLSMPGHALIELGFLAATSADEKKCPDLEVDQLVDITHISGQIKAVTAGREGPAFRQAEETAIATVERKCTTDDAVRCDVVTLFHGGTYDLYKYRRYQDVRLVFVPEEDAASFGDATTADWPLHALDMSLVRAYENGSPIDTRANHLSFAHSPAKVGDLVFVVGNPGETKRLNTVAQLELERDIYLPIEMEDYAELHGMMAEAVRENPGFAEQANVFESELEVGRSTLQHRALANTGILAARARAEAVLRARVAEDPELNARFGRAWDQIAQAAAQERAVAERVMALEFSPQQSELMLYALLLVRDASQLAKPDGQRLHSYRDSNQAFLRAKILSPAPAYPSLETRTMTWAFSRLLLHLGTSDPATIALIGHESPRDLAARLVDGTRVGDLKARQALLDGGAAAVASSTDPLIVYMRDKWEPLGLAVREKYEDAQAVYSKNAALIDQARLAVFGDNAYPDATFTPRLAYGVVRGYRHGEAVMPAETTFGEAFALNTERVPFRLPKSWRDAKTSLEMTSQLNLVSTADVIGGNSGSPMVDRNGELVGLVFAVNDAFEAGPFGYDDTEMRAASVSVLAIRTALTSIYHADRIVQELDRK
jgi:hypothetical protein